jgi:hypothetical protein
MISNLPLPLDVQQAIYRLTSLYDGDVGVAEVVACGTRAVQPLRALLFEREGSGLYQSRCRAVDALAALGAYDVLSDFLIVPRTAADPVERVGDEAVINAAALALAQARDEHTFELLMTVVSRRLLPGVIGALGAFQRTEAIPCLIAALAEDDCRQAAENALAKIGRGARHALIAAAIRPRPSCDRESESSLRSRRSALELLVSIGIRPATWAALRPLLGEQDPKVKVLACKICLASAPSPEKLVAIGHLIDVLPNADWMLGDEIESCLVDHFDIAREVIAANVAAEDKDGSGVSTQMGVLHRVKRQREARSRKRNDQDRSQ